MSSIQFRSNHQMQARMGAAQTRGAASGQAKQDVDWLSMFIDAIRQHKMLSMALGFAGQLGGAAMGALRKGDGLQQSFVELLSAADFAADRDLRTSLVDWARMLSQNDNATLCDWLGIPLVEQSGLPVKTANDQLSNPGSVVGEKVLPEVMDGVLSLPRKDWAAAMTAGTFRGIRPGQSSSVSSGFVNVISHSKATELAGERLGADATEDEKKVEAQKMLSEGVAHEVGHTVDNALPEAHTALCQALGYEAFRPEQASAYLGKAGVGWDADPAVAAKVVQLWLENEDWSKLDAEGWKTKLLQAAHLAVHRTGEPDAASFEKSALFGLLQTSKDPTSVEKTVQGGAGLSLYAKAQEAQVWGAGMYTHLKAWNNGRAALSDREYCAELYRMAMTADDKDNVVAAYPSAAKAWLAKVEAL